MPMESALRRRAALAGSKRNHWRNSGIDGVGDLAWGAHLCQFYSDRAEALEVLAPYFAAGLASNEYCMWVTSETFPIDEAKSALQKLTPNLRHFIDNDQIEFIGHRDWYARDGHFDPERVQRDWQARYEAALKRGFDGLRISGDTSWLPEDEWDHFIRHEEQLDPVISSSRMLVICTYSLSKCDLPKKVDALATHDWAMVRRNGRWHAYRTRRKHHVEPVGSKDEVQRLHEDRLSALGGMTTAIAHEIAQPLTAATFHLAGAVRAMRLRDGQPEPMVEGAVRQAFDEVLRASAIVRCLRDFVALGDVSKTFQSLHALIVGASELVGASAREGGVEIHLGLGATNDRVLADGVLMKQVMVNLMCNAIEAMQATERRELAVSTSTVGDAIRVRIADSGPGLSEEIRKRLFEPFSTSKTKGMGVGLSLARSIVEAHYGKIGAENEADGGAVFHITLPLAE